MKRGASGRALGPLALASIVAATLAVATVVSKEFFERPAVQTRPMTPPSRTTVIADAGTAKPIREAGVEGQVEALHEGQWYVLQAGDSLALQDVIRTPKGSRVVLRRGGIEIDVPQSMDIRVEELALRAATFGLLRGGRVSASVEEQDQKVAFTANEGRAENVGPARFVFSATPGGATSVASTSGDVRFSARGGAVTVSAGTESTAAAGQAPSRPEPIPEELLLSVIWPEIAAGERDATLAGKARPSSQVKINGVATPLGPDGSFAATVPLAAGANRVQVEAEDMAGRKKSVERTFRRAPRTPTLQQADEELWKR